MTAGCLTFEEIESRAETSVGIAIFAKRMRDGVRAAIANTILLPILANKMEQLATDFRSGGLEKLSNEQLKNLAELLKQLNALTAELQCPIGAPRMVERNLKRIKDKSEDFESVIENIYLVLDPNFHKAVSSAIDKLHLGVEESATLLR